MQSKYKKAQIHKALLKNLITSSSAGIITVCKAPISRKYCFQLTPSLCSSPYFQGQLTDFFFFYLTRVAKILFLVFAGSAEHETDLTRASQTKHLVLAIHNSKPHVLLPRAANGSRMQKRNKGSSRKNQIMRICSWP